MSVNHQIGDLVAGAGLPADGVDLRAELFELQRARVSQALARAAGDLGFAARLLRMTRLDLVRLESRLAAAMPSGDAPRRRPEPELAVRPENVNRIADGIEYVSAAAIKRLRAEGKSERAIATALGCNPYIVERVLREQTEREVLRLDREGATVHEISAATRVPLGRVRRILSRSDEAPE